MKDTLKLVGPNGEKANVDAGSEAEAHFRKLGWVEAAAPEAAGDAKRGPGRPRKE